MYRFHLRATLFATALVLATVVQGCQTPTPNAPPPPSAADCPSTCERLRKMECKLGQPTKRGHTCEELCVAMESGSVSFVGCTANAATCEAANHCQ